MCATGVLQVANLSLDHKRQKDAKSKETLLNFKIFDSGHPTALLGPHWICRTIKHVVTINPTVGEITTSSSLAKTTTTTTTTTPTTTVAVLTINSLQVDTIAKVYPQITTTTNQIQETTDSFPLGPSRLATPALPIIMLQL